MTSPKPRILICIDWYLPGYKGGGPIRSVANLAAALSEYFEFLVLCSDRDHGDKASYPGIVADAWTDGPNGEKVWYCSPDKRSYRHLKAILNETEYDLLYLHSVFSLPFTIFPMWISRATHPDRPVLLAPRGMLHPGALSLKPTKKKIFIKALNLLGIPKQITFHATDEQEIKDIGLQFGNHAQVHLAPNLGPAVLPANHAIHKEPGQLKMVYLSRLSAKKGVDYLLECLQNQESRIELTICGPDEEPGYWEKCTEIAKRLPENIKINKIPPVPPIEAVRVIQDSHVFVLPTKGENFGHAIVEAMSAGRPVMISDQTPWKNLASRHAGMEIPLQDKQAWVEAIRKFAGMDQHEMERWESGSRNLAMEVIVQSSAKAHSRQMFDGVIEKAAEEKAKREGR